MAHVTPLTEEGADFLSATLKQFRQGMGFVPNSLLTMAHMPQLPVAFSILARVVFGGDLREMLPAAEAEIPAVDDSAQSLPPDLVQLVVYAASLAAGCRYCQAHTSHGASHRGVPADKLCSILDYQDDNRFSSMERAALSLAFAAAAAAVPNEATEDHFKQLREHFNVQQIVQLVAVVALFGFLNRWNDTLATAMEEAPGTFAESALGAHGWSVGKHGR